MWCIIIFITGCFIKEFDLNDDRFYELQNQRFACRKTKLDAVKIHKEIILKIFEVDKILTVFLNRENLGKQGFPIF